MQCYSVGEQYYVRSFGKFGCASSVTRPNEVDTTFSYENNRNLIFQVTNGTVSAYGYVNNAIGRRTSISRSGSVFSAADVLSYTYNSRNEVIGAQSNVDSGYNYSYAFDPIGNRLVANLAGTNWGHMGPTA